MQAGADVYFSEPNDVVRMVQEAFRHHTEA